LIIVQFYCDVVVVLNYERQFVAITLQLYWRVKAVGYCFESLLSVSHNFKLCDIGSKAFYEVLRRHAQAVFCWHFLRLISRKNRLL